MRLLLKPSDLDVPIPPEQLFGRAAPLVLEIGFGGGRFLTRLAEQHPDWNVLGVELSGGSMTRAFKRVRRAEVTNVRLFRGNGRFVVRDVLPPRSLQRLYVNFPDPWPKKQHRDRRLLRRPFFRLLSTRLAPRGQIYLTTDHDDYFRAAVRAGQRSGLYRIALLPPPAATLQTKYAKRWREQQKSIRHAVFTKAREAAGAFPPVIQPAPMHHAILQGELPDLSTFEKQVHRFESGTVVLLEAYRAINEKGYLFLTLVEEDAFTQKVLIEARPSRKGIFVGLKSFGDALSTTGTSEAVGYVTEWLETQGLEVVEALY